MKLIEKEFTDLAKALEYIKELNEAYKKLAAAANTSAEDLKKALARCSELLAQIDGLKADIEKEKNVSLEALTVVADLSAQLSAQEEHSGEGIVVTIGKEKRLLVGDTFLYGGSTKTAKELSQDQEQLKKMLDKNSGALVEIN